MTLLRAATASPPRSTLELTGTLMGRPFDATVSTDRAGRARVVLDGFVFSDEREMARLVAPFAGADQLDQLTLDGLVAGRKVRRSLGPGGVEVVR